MRARTLLVLVAIALSGCATDTPPLVAPMGASALTCTSQSCEVIVTVGPGCNVSTNGYTLTVATGNSDDVTVTWRIDPASSGTVVFTASGIDPKPEFNGPWHSEFKHGALGSPATTFTWVDKNKTKRKPYGYNVFVTQNGVACAKYDPIIINN